MRPVLGLPVEPSPAAGGLPGGDDGGQRLDDDRPQAPALPQGQRQHRRAGADGVLTYAAVPVARRLKSG